MPLSPDWDRFLDAMDPEKFRASFRRESRIAMQAVGRECVREAKRLIRSRAYAKNADSTITRKGSSTPLVDNNDLVNSIRSVVQEDAAGMVAVIGANRRSDTGANIAAILHAGVPGNGPSGWRIPPRPFLRRAAQSSVVADKLKEKAKEAAKKAMGVRP